MTDSTTPLSRRGFLRAASTGLALGSLPFSPFHRAAAAVQANNRINVAHLGVGSRGRSILRNMVQRAAEDNPEVAITAVCDVYAKRRAQAEDHSGAKGYRDYREILDREDVDAVVIATPDHWHAQISIEAMRKGKDVYVEKPMTHTIEEALDLEKVVAETGRVLQVGSQTTSNDNWWRAHEAITSGMIGKMLMSQGSYHRNYDSGAWNGKIDPGASPDATGENHIDWDLWLGPAAKRPFSAERFFRFRKYWDYSGGIATDLFYHVMAPLNIAWERPQTPWRVIGTGGIYIHNDGREVPDTFTLTAEYKEGHMVVLSSSMANDHHIPGTIRGNEGTILITTSGKFEDPSNETKVVAQSLYRDKFVEKFGSEEVVLPNRVREAHMDNFLRCIRTREKPVLDVHTGLCAQVAITLAVQSYRTGKAMYFDETTGKIADEPPSAA